MRKFVSGCHNINLTNKRCNITKNFLNRKKFYTIVFFTVPFSGCNSMITYIDMKCVFNNSLNFLMPDGLLVN
jgi:hypothetical protein